jgi:hypothetical protein
MENNKLNQTVREMLEGAIMIRDYTLTSLDNKIFEIKEKRLHDMVLDLDARYGALLKNEPEYEYLKTLMVYYVKMVSFKFPDPLLPPNKNFYRHTLMSFSGQ